MPRLKSLDLSHNLLAGTLADSPRQLPSYKADEYVRANTTRLSSL